MKSLCERVTKLTGKGNKCWLQAFFFPFPPNFSKGFFLQVFKTHIDLRQLTVSKKTKQNTMCL